MSSFKNFSVYRERNHCLRCGYEWKGNRRKNREKVESAPVSCARCRSPLWNTPRKNKQPSLERAREWSSLRHELDCYKNLYKCQKERTEELFKENHSLKKLLKDAKAESSK